MKIYDLKDEAGHTFAFEVLNFGRHRACRFVSKMPGVKVIKRQSISNFSHPMSFVSLNLGAKDLSCGNLMAIPVGFGSAPSHLSGVLKLMKLKMLLHLIELFGYFEKMPLNG